MNLMRLLLLSLVAFAFLLGPWPIDAAEKQPATIIVDVYKSPG
jgi:hypothetical protein